MTTCQAQIKRTLGVPSGEGQVGMIRAGAWQGEGRGRKGKSNSLHLSRACFICASTVLTACLICNIEDL